MCGIILMILGVVTLIRGKVNFSKSRVVTGAPAYLIGALLIAPFPTGFLIGVVMGAQHAAGGGGNLQALQRQAIFLDVGLYVVCIGAAVIVGAAAAKPPKTADRERRLRDEEREWEDVDDIRTRRADPTDDVEPSSDGPPDERIRDRPS